MQTNPFEQKMTRSKSSKSQLKPALAVALAMALIIVAVWSVFAALVTSGLAADNPPRVGDAPVLSTDFDPRSVFDPRNGRALPIVIADTKLSIPANYFDRAAVPRSTDQVAMLLHAFMPGMEPVRNDTMEEFRTRRGQGRRAMILVEDARSTTDLQYRLEAALKLAAPFGTSTRYGLDSFESIIGPTPRAFRMDVLTHKTGDHVDDVVECSLEAEFHYRTYPNCSHEFIYGNFIVHVTYGKPYLPQWRAVNELVVKLLSAFSGTA